MRLTMTSWLKVIFVLTAAAMHFSPAFGGDTVPASGFRAAPGEAFFLLADRSFATDEVASVRLEAPGRDNRRMAIEAYGGIDVRVYHVPDAIKFLRKQPNLHRIQVEAAYQGEGLSNALGYLWDNWYKQSRRSMQRAFAADARAEVTAQIPKLATQPMDTPTQFHTPVQFAPIKGLMMVDSFRYPIFQAKPIRTPDGVKLDGSTDQLMDNNPGNVYVPIGRREPGLYVVEAIIGKYRAVTTVFVSDTIAISKIAGMDLLVWSIERASGKAVPGTKIVWSDGVGVLQSGKSDRSGLLRMKHASPERSYLMGVDAEGGVFVSENFYYASEIYDTKIYAYTDRPLYRAGDKVHVKIMARTFLDATRSQAAKSAPLSLSVIDAQGAQLLTQTLQLDAASGAASEFIVPTGAVAGGYELKMRYLDQSYSAAFRVSEYVKPHFEISLAMDKSDFRTGDAVSGKIKLLYPDGKPVAGANINLTLRSQQQTMVDHELAELGQFPIELTTADLQSDADGVAALQLPASEKPARYVLTIFATDGAAFRVKTTREILIERDAAKVVIDADKRFSQIDEGVNFSAATVTGNTPQAIQAVRYRWVRLEDQASNDGQISSGQFAIKFLQAGSYNIFALDSANRVLGGTEHRVSGAGLKIAPGSVQITLNRREYQIGDVAQALISFSEPTDEALLSLERDSVEAHALLSQGGDWLKLEKLNATQFRAMIPVRPGYAPNMSFSVLYAKRGEYAFENKGIKVKVPSIAVAVSANKEVYKPGDMVELQLQSTLAGQAKATRISLAVVDEMIYALQPEIAPGISDFFYHPRRNAVRTSASLSFIAYDLALPYSPVPKTSNARSERGVKVLERPRRDEVDTALFAPDIVTDAEGRASIRFVMPDSLTRWRITAKAMAMDGAVGESQRFIRSEQPLYLTWSAAKQFRLGDVPELGVLIFNTTQQAQNAELIVDRLCVAGTGCASADANSPAQTLNLLPGVQYVSLPGISAVQGELRLRLRQNATDVDQLRVSLQQVDPRLRMQSQVVSLTGLLNPAALPEDATQISVKLFGNEQALLARHLDQLIDYPWWGASGIASTLLPLSVAYPSIARGDKRIAERVRLAINVSRLRLMHMASDSAYFRWWYGTEPDAFITAFAYLADWHASRAMGVVLEAEHWQRVQTVYAEQAGAMPWLQRALAIDMAADMQLPIQTTLSGLMAELATAVPNATATVAATDSLVMQHGNSALALQTARVLSANLAVANRIDVPPGLAQQLPAALSALQSAAGSNAFVQATLARHDRNQVKPSLQATIAIAQPIERAIALAWYAPPALQTQPLITMPPAGNWRAQAGGFQWAGPSRPREITLARMPQAGTTAEVSYLSTVAAPTQRLPMTITRKLYKLLPQTEALAFAVEHVLDGVVDSNSLYLDEIELSATEVLRYGVVTVPLPPGADIERTTWGLRITGLAGTDTQGLERAQFEDFSLGYQLPIDTLGAVDTTRFRHLVRFSQRGKFSLPPVSYRKLYAPDQSAEAAVNVMPTLEVVR